MDRTTYRVGVIAAVSVAAGLFGPAPRTAAQEVAEAAGQAQPAVTIRFNFKDAPFDQVLDFFARQSGVPVIRETDVPPGAMTFISPRSYSLPEALDIFNQILHPHNVHVRAEGDYLYLGKLDVTKPTIVGARGVPEGVLPGELLTVSFPLDHALADMVAQQLTPMKSPFGSITPVPAQNMVVVIDTAAQCKRLGDLIEIIDAVRPVDSAFRLFPLQYAQSDAAVNALKGLVGERRTTVVIDKDGNQRKIDENVVPGLNIQSDQRTNSVIVVGPESRISLVEELIALLDVPEGAAQGETQMRTFSLGQVSPQDAAKQLGELFRSVDKKAQPTILPLTDAGKITVVASQSLMLQATALIAEIDPSAGGAPSPIVERETRVVPLKFAQPRNIEQMASRLLSPRQQGVLRFAASPDQKGIVVTGPAPDVQEFAALVSSLDQPLDSTREVRQVNIASGDPASIIAHAEDLYQRTGQAEVRPVDVLSEEGSRQVTLIGTREGVSSFSQLLQTAQQAVVIDREMRTFQVTETRPSELSARLARLCRPLLEPDDGSAYVSPEFEPMDELRQLIVRARPDQFTVIEGLIAQVSEPDIADRQFRIMRLNRGDPEQVLARAQELYAEQTAGLSPSEGGPVSAEYDAASGSIIIKAGAAGMRRFTEVLTQVQQLVPPDRVTRIIALQQAEAQSILAPLEQFLASADPIDPMRAVPEPTVRVVERTNSLLVTAEEAQHRLIADYVRQLDQLEATSLPPLRLLQLRAADASAIARMLTQRYQQRPAQERLAKPVNVEADATTNTLIVSAHEDEFEVIRTLVDDMNKEQREGPERVTVLFPLKVAKAEQVAAAMDKLYPQPPMPVDRYGRPQPWLQEDKEVTVSAEPSSNSLIIDAPADRMDSLEELAAKLDRVELPPVAELRTYRIIGPDLNTLSRTLNNLARQGNLSAPAQPGKQPVQVVIEAEPVSNTLIVAGDETTFERVEQMLEDLSAVPIERSLRIIPIANTEAEGVRERALAIYESQIAQIPDATGVDVSINDATNSLEVVGDAEAMQRFVRIIDELQRQAGPARELRMIELRLAKVGDVIAVLEEMVSANRLLTDQGGPDPVFEPIEKTNAVMIAAQPSQLRIIEQLVHNLDNQQTADRPPLRILRLRTTDATNLAGVLQQSFDQRPPEERAFKPVSIQADSATNTMVVSAHPDMLAEIEDIVQGLNEAQTLGEEDREIRIFPLRVARAEELAKTIDAMYPEPPIPYDRDRFGRVTPRPDLRQPKEVVVRADQATNSLIVDAPAKRLAGFEQIVRSLDQHEPAGDLELRTFRLERAQLDSAVRTLNSLSQTGALGTRDQARVSITAEPGTRTLVVSGPSEIFDAVQRVLDELDSPGDAPATSIKLYALKNARADRLQPLLERLLLTRLREDTSIAEDRLQSMLEVAADQASNTLIISAPATVQQVAEQLIESLDVESSRVGQQIIRVMPLTYADASQTATSLQQLVRGIDLPTGGVVSIMAAVGSNALLLTGAEADLAKVEELAGDLDRRPSDADTPAVETFALDNADANAVAQTVERLLVNQQQTDPRIIAAQMRYTRGQIPRTAQIKVEAEPRTNSLIVSAPQATLELARSVIEKLDQPGATDRTAATFTPARAEPGNLVQAVRRVADATIPRGRLPLELTPESATGSVIVIGTADQVQEAVRLLAEYDDRSPELPVGDFSVFELSHAEARSTAGTLQGLLRDRSRWPDELKRAASAGVSLAEPSVNADAGTNRLIVAAPTALMPLASELIESLDRASARDRHELRVFSLREGDAASVAEALRAALSVNLGAGEPAPSVTPEPRSNSLVVTGAPERLAQAEQVIQTLDKSVAPADTGVRTVFLEHARAESVAPIVEQLLVPEREVDLLPDWYRPSYLAQVARAGGSAVGTTVRVAAEGRLNAVVVSGPTAVLDVAEQMIGELDIDPASAGGVHARRVRVIPLANADAQQLASSIEAMFTQEDSTDRAPIVRVDAASNALIVRASDAQLAEIEALASELDSATLSTTREMRTIAVDPSRADAARVAETIRRLLEQQGAVRVEIVPFEELVKPIEDPESSGRSSMALPAIIGSLVIAQPSAADAGASDDDARRVRIAVDPATNTLIVIGSPRVAERVESLARAIEAEMPREPTKMRIVELPEEIEANSLVNVVNQTVGQFGRLSATNPGGLTGSVRVTPHPEGGALIVWANDTDFRVVGELIGAVARVQPAAEVVVKLYPLNNVSASRAVRAVQDLLSPTPRGRFARSVRSALAVTIKGEGDDATGTIDPSRVSVMEDPSGMSLVVSAPGEALAVIDRLIEVLDQTPAGDNVSIRTYALRNARARELSGPLQQLFDAQRQGPRAGDIARTRFVADDRTNSLLVAATDRQHAEIEHLIATADVEQVEDDLTLAIIPLEKAPPSVVARIVQEVVFAGDPGKSERVRISAEDDTSLFIVRAREEDIAQIREIVAQVDRAETTGLPVHSITLEHADATLVARELQRFFDQRDRAGARRRGAPSSRVIVIGEPVSGTLVIAASDEDFEQVQQVAASFDTADAAAAQYRVVALEHVAVTDIQSTVEGVLDDFTWGGFWNPRQGRGADERVHARANDRLNAFLLVGRGDMMDLAEQLIRDLDVADAPKQLVARAVRVDPGIDLNSIAQIVQEVTRTPGWRSWQGLDAGAVQVRVDRQRGLLLLLGQELKVKQAEEYVKALTDVPGVEQRTIVSIPMSYASAERTANNISRLLNERARQAGLPSSDAVVVGSRDGNVLLVSADDEQLSLIRDMAATLDQDLGEQRELEVFTLRNARAEDTARTVREQFPSTTRSDDRVIVTPQPSNNWVIVSAPSEVMGRVQELIQKLDTPPTPDDVRIATVSLKSARVEDVVEALRSALPEAIKVEITPVPRNNTILVTGSEEAIDLVVAQAEAIDAEPVPSPLKFRRIRLVHAEALDVYSVLRQMARNRRRSPSETPPSVDYSSLDNTVILNATADELAEFEAIIAEMDVPTDRERTTEFVRLEFANAEPVAQALKVFYGSEAWDAPPGARAVKIVPDPASNSLVISAGRAEWEGIRELLGTLDSAEYDSSRQFVVIPLRHADATSVATALNDGFRAPLEDELQRERARQERNQRNRNNDRDLVDVPTVLVEDEGRPSVSPEPITNSLVVFAGRKDLERIRLVVEQLDSEEFVDLPEARVIPLKTGRASQLAASIRQVFVPTRGQQVARRAVITGDDRCNCLIVRAGAEEFTQIKALAEALELKSDENGIRVRVLSVSNIPAARVQRTIATTFSRAAQANGESLAVEIDRDNNALVIASTERLFKEIEEVVHELDGMPDLGANGDAKPPLGGLGRSVLIIDVNNSSPQEVRQLLEQMGVTRPQSDDRPGVVSEPVTIVPLTTRRALAVVASPGDAEAIVSLVRALDAEPRDQLQQVAVVPMRIADASAVVRTMRELLNAQAGVNAAPPGQALVEQVRRLNVVRAGNGLPDLELDLGIPVRLIPDATTNAVIIGSSASNAAALAELVRMFDELPLGDAVVARIFPLRNASATRVRSIIDDLFRRSDQLRTVPGTNRRILPDSTTGRALIGQIAITVDERTNALIVAGREEALAFVEVLINDLDGDEVAGWVEPTIVQLEHADATRLARTLNDVLVNNLESTPEAQALQRQVVRLRVAAEGRDPVEADLFAPMSGLVITPEEQLNALIIVGSTANVQTVRALVGMLDVEAAGVDNSVRIYPLEWAAADRVGSMIENIFRQRERQGDMRPEDRLVVVPDARTNALVVSTSPRSFAIVDSLVKSLDGEEASYAVGIHVLPVPGADVTRLAPRIDRLMRERINAQNRGGGVQTARDTFTIEPEPTSSSLLITCSDENLQLVKDLIDTLIAEGEQTQTGQITEIVSAGSLRAPDLVRDIEQLYVAPTNARRGADSVSVVANERMNVLVVRGTEEDVTAIRELVEEFSTAQIETVQQIRRIELKTANALEVVDMISEVLAGRPIGRGSAGNQATILQFHRKDLADAMRQSGVAEAEIDDAIRQQIRLSPNLRTNSVMVAAPPGVFEFIEAMILDLDGTDAGQRTIAQFRLVNADASAMARVLRDLFNLRQQGDALVLVPSRRRAGEAEEDAPQDLSVTPVPDERQQLAITIDTRTNTLLVSGTEEYITLVREVVDELDSVEANEREQVVYTLKNALAAEVQQTLQEYFREEADRLRQVQGGSSGESLARQLEREVVVVGDEKSAKVLISASPRYIETVRSIVEELDSAPPQVLIQVLIAEVTIDDSEQWGIDVEIGPFGGDGYIAGALAAGAGVATALGVPNLSVSSADFSLLVRALEAQGKLEVLSRPQITVNNNEEAELKVGEDIAIVTNVDRLDNGDTRANVERREVGVILSVLPTINPDGFVRLDIDPEISQLSQRTVQISEDFQAPIISIRNFSTTVTVKDGQTVVIGGLRQSSSTERRSKFPVIGDIPIIGIPFRSNDRQNQQTELLVLLTPHVVHGDSESAMRRLNELTSDAIDRTVNPESIRAELPMGDENGPDVSPVGPYDPKKMPTPRSQ